MPLLKWQPMWHARQKYLQKLRHGASLKKKMAVALACKLAKAAWHVTAHDVDYDEQRVFPQ